jgi:hypothetical protein
MAIAERNAAYLHFYILKPFNSACFSKRKTIFFVFLFLYVSY